MAPYQGFIGDYDQSQSLTADCEVTRNFYFEQLPQHGKNRGALYPTPGFRTWLALTDVGSRGALDINGRTFVVWGTGFYEIFSTVTYTRWGTITQDNNPATLTSNGIAGGQIFITSGGNGYCFTLATNTLSQVLTGDATMGGMLDGYFVAFDATTSKIRLSDLNDGTTWDPTQFAQRSTAPDQWKSMIVVQQPAGIWLIGEQTGEVWYDAGTFPFPFAPIPGASFRYGTPAPFSVSACGDRINWLSRNSEGSGVIVTARGYTPQKISTAAIDTALADYSTTSVISDAEAMVYQTKGHTFYNVTFPTAEATLTFDQDTNKWAIRGKYSSVRGRHLAWHPRVHVYAFGLHLVGDRSTNTIAVMDDATGTELDGTAIVRDRIAPGIFNEHQRILQRRLELYLEAGLGTISGAGSAPVCLLRTSDDGGKTYLPERSASVGTMGNFQTRVVFTRLGMPRDRVYWLRCTDPIPYRIIDAYINNESSQGRAA